MPEQKFDLHKLRSNLIKISSDDKATSSISNSSFTVNLPASSGDIDSIAGVAIHHISCPNVFPNIPSYANTLVLERAAAPGVGFTATIAVDQYTIAELAVQLKTAIDAAIAPDSVAITYPTGKLAFAFTDGGLDGDWGVILADSPVAYRLGITADTPTTSSWTAQEIPNLIGETEVYVHCREIAPARLMEVDGHFAVVSVLPLDVPYGGVAYYKAYNDEMNQIQYFPWNSKKSFRRLNVKLRNSNGNILTLPDNFTFNMIMRSYFTS